MNSLSLIVFLGVAVLAACQIYPTNTVNFPFDVPQCMDAGDAVGEKAGSEACSALIDQCVDEIIPPPFEPSARASSSAPNIKACQNNYKASCKGPCVSYWTTCLANNPRVDDPDVFDNCGDPRNYFTNLCNVECSSAFNYAIGQ